MRAHVLQHVPFETAAAIGPWLDAVGARVTTTALFAPHALPDPADVDFLIVMGGPMSANDEQALPWLAGEKRLLRQLVDAGRPVLGICLGAQLIASAMGARVYPNAEKEIGWLPVRAVPTTGQDNFQLPARMLAFHWHGETFDLPDGAVHLARSEGCVHQAFQLGACTIGMQFHLEVQPDGVEALVEHCGHELVPGRYVQTARDIRSVAPTTYAAMSDVLSDLLTFLAARA